MRGIVAVIDHADTHACVAAERRLLEALGGDCHSPVAALATVDGDGLWLRAEILTNDGSEVQRGEARFASGDDAAPAALGKQLLDRASPALRGLFAG